MTERTTDGAKPAIIAKEDNERSIIINLSNEPRLVLGTGFNIKVTKSNMNPICNPETDKI